MDLPVIPTARLVLRARSIDDLDACVAMHADPEVVRYFGGVRPPEDVRAEIAHRIGLRHPAGLGYWTVQQAGTEDFLGWAALIPVEDRGPEIEVGYRLRREAWGRGLGTEAAAALLDHGFGTLGLGEIVAMTHPDNHRSQRVLAKLGFRRAGQRFAWGIVNDFFRLPAGARLVSEPR
jgi:RimJ/RimL family protein N-acetyltransferase